MYKGDGYCAEWKNTRMRVTTMPQYLAKLPTETQKVIGYVQKITGIYNGKMMDWPIPLQEINVSCYPGKKCLEKKEMAHLPAGYLVRKMKWIKHFNTSISQT